MIGFESYLPEMWIEQGLIVKAPRHRTTLSQPKQRNTRWANAIAASALSVSVCLAAVTALILPNTAGANSIAALANAPNESSNAAAKRKEEPTISPLRDINRSFNTLFESFRAAQALIPSDDLKQLANRAAEQRGKQTDTDSWATKLGDDIKAAND